MDLYSIHVLYIQYIYTFVQYMLFISNAIKMYEVHIHSFWYSSFQLDWDGLATQTLQFPT
jgi:hypothetical protein